MFDFHDRVAMITGAAGNLGQATARGFLAAGARLILVDRAAGRLAELFPELADSPDHILADGVDLTGETAVAEAVQEARRRLGRIDVLVNAAGGYRAGRPVHETTAAEWEFLFDLNVRTALNACRAVIPLMLEQGYGRIVNVASRAALSGEGKAGAYSAAKAAVLRLTESLSSELKRSGIGVNCVAPSIIDTPQNRLAMPKADPSRWVAPEALADVILFLASDAARAVHGAVIPVYGLI